MRIHACMYACMIHACMYASMRACVRSCVDSCKLGATHIYLYVWTHPDQERMLHANESVMVHM